MSNYTKNTNFTAKDNLTSGDPAKVIKGAEFDTEFNSLQTAVNSKADSNNSQLTGITDAQAVETTGDVTVGGNLSVTGNATIAGNLTFGDADTDTVSFSADVDSNILPNTDATYDLGSATKEWRDLYVDGTAYVDTVNLNGSNITATAAELNVLDGITATTAELNYTDGVTSNIQTQLNSKAATTTSPTITLAGDLSGSATLTNLGNATLTATVADDSHNHVISNVDGLQTALDSKANLSGANFTGSVDVTGTITADGLTVDGDILAGRTSAFTSAKLELQNDETLQVALNNTSADGQMLSLYNSGNLVGGLGNSVQDLNIYRGSTVAVSVSNSTGDVSFYEDTGTTAKFVWDASAESLELGTSSGYAPVSTLAINETINTPAIEIIPTADDNNANTASIRLWGTRFGTANRHSEIRNVTDGSTANNELAFDTNGTERMRINSAGNVGIGTASPNSPLTVQSDSGGGNITLIGRASDGYSSLAFKNNANTAILGAIFADDASDSMQVHVAGSERARIDSSGNLLVGMTSTSSTDGAYITQGGSVVIASSLANTTSSYLGWTSPVFTSGNQTKYGIRLSNGSSQNFNFGQFTDSSGFLGTLIQSDNTNLGTIIRSGSNGVRLSVNASSWSSYSDERLKDISGNIDSALDKVDAMRGVYFSWKEDEESKTYCGLIAQEVEAVLPEVIDDDSDYKQVRYTEIIPLLVEAIKELKAQNKTLKARIETLENK